MKTAVCRVHWPHLSCAVAKCDSGLPTGCHSRRPTPLQAALWASTGLGDWTDPEQLFNVTSADCWRPAYEWGGEVGREEASPVLQDRCEVTAHGAPGAVCGCPGAIPKPGSTRDRSGSADRPRGADTAHLCVTKTRQARQARYWEWGSRGGPVQLPWTLRQPLSLGGRGRGATQRGGPSRLLFPEPYPADHKKNSLPSGPQHLQNQAASLTRTSDCHQQPLSPAAPWNTLPWARRALPRPKRLPPGLSSEPDPAAVGKRCPLPCKPRGAG